jgi:hypothetical protein
MILQPSRKAVRPGEFRNSLNEEFNAYLARESCRFAAEDTLRVDMHR